MSLIGRLSSSSSQNFACSRRELPGKLFAIGAALLLPERHSANLTLEKYPKAQFAIGDKVADHWIDEFNNETIEYGEICGVCWSPREQDWLYSIEWTHGGMPGQYYPCFDERLTMGDGLRLVKQS